MANFETKVANLPYKIDNSLIIHPKLTIYPRFYHICLKLERNTKAKLGLFGDICFTQSFYIQKLYLQHVIRDLEAKNCFISKSCFDFLSGVCKIMWLLQYLIFNTIVIDTGVKCKVYTHKLYCRMVEDYNIALVYILLEKHYWLVEHP